MPERPSTAFVVHLDNGKKFAFSYNKDRKMVVLFGKYTDANKAIFQVTKIQKFKNVIDAKYTDLTDRETVKQVVAPYIKNLTEMSEKIKGI